MNNDAAKDRRWRSSPDIRKELAQSSTIDSIRETFALRSYIRNAFLAQDYKALPDWERIVALSPAGEEALQLSGTTPITELSRADILMAAFCLFYHHEILVDCAKSDLKALGELVNAEMHLGNFAWPYRFGRLLYDKFNDSYSGDRTDHLLPEQALTLLKGTPQGVYQVGRLVSGPLGLLGASCARYIPPSRSLVLWHCSDPGCQKAHRVNLLPVEAPVVRLVSDMRKALESRLGPPSEWGNPLADLVGADIPREPFTYYDVCTIIADCITGDERTCMVTAAISGSSGNFIRAKVGSLPRKLTAGQGAPQAVAKALSEAEQLQVLFLLKDAELVGLIDQCITQGTIRIPLAEIRRAMSVPPAHSGTPKSEVSSLGIRCSSNEPLLDFCALLWEAYSSSGRTSELDWRLRNRLASGTQNALLDYLCKSEPSLAVKDLILASEPVTKAICERLKCGVENSGDKGFVDRLLWKLGFDLPRFSDTLGLLRRRMEIFNQELLAVGALRGEQDRERIRSAGVNLFVSVEEFLEQISCFNVWLLASDHFVGTKFRYDADSARRKVAEVLGQSIISGEVEVRWDSEEANTLGTSMAYLTGAANWMKSILSNQTDQLLRPAADMPDFAENKFRVFPFRHTALWADSDLGSLERLSNDFAGIVTRIARSNLAGIRNGLDHHRDEAGFPRIDEMLAFVAHFREAVDIADVNRFFPKEFWLERTHKDRFGRQEFEFKDYVGRSHVFFGPSFVRGILAVPRNVPVVIAPGNLLGFANAEIVFRLRETSGFSKFWEGYPRRRKIPNGQTQVARLQQPAAEQEPGSTLDS